MEPFKGFRANRTAAIYIATFVFLGYVCTRIQNAIAFDVVVLAVGTFILVTIYLHQTKRGDDGEAPGAHHHRDHNHHRHKH